MPELLLAAPFATQVLAVLTDLYRLQNLSGCTKLLAVEPGPPQPFYMPARTREDTRFHTIQDNYGRRNNRGK